MRYIYDDYDYWTEHEPTVSEKEKQKVLKEIAKEDFFNTQKKCA